VTGRRARIAGGTLLLALIAAGAALAWRGGLFEVLSRREELQRLVLELGPWGPVAIVGFQVLQVLFAPVPGQITSIVAGYLYGVLWGTVLCMVGLVLGTAIAMGLARRYGRPFVERLVSPEVLERLDRYLERRGPLAFFLIFLLPFLPDDATAFVAGLSSLRLSQLLLLATVGRLPGVVVAALLGARAGELGAGEIALLGAATLALLILFWRFHGPVERAIFRLADRLAGRERGGA
jgi:uncharacterized membrane protein YdjX (TVP38/TMEM64 family)